MSSCSPPARGRGISRMPGSAERVGSPAPQVTDRATENETRCPTRPGADSLNPCPLPTPRPAQDAQSIPPAPIVIPAQAGISQFSRAASAARDPSLRWGDGWGNRTTGRKAGRRSRRGAETAEGSRLPYRCDPPPRSDIKRNAASHDTPPRPPRLCAQTPWPPSQKRRSAPRLPTTTYPPLRPLPRALRVTFHRSPPKSHPEPTHSRVCP